MDETLRITVGNNVYYEKAKSEPSSKLLSCTDDLRNVIAATSISDQRISEEVLREEEHYAKLHQELLRCDEDNAQIFKSGHYNLTLSSSLDETDSSRSYHQRSSVDKFDHLNDVSQPQRYYDHERSHSPYISNNFVPPDSSHAHSFPSKTSSGKAFSCQSTSSVRIKKTFLNDKKSEYDDLNVCNIQAEKKSMSILHRQPLSSHEKPLHYHSRKTFSETHDLSHSFEAKHCEPSNLFNKQMQVSRTKNLVSGKDSINQDQSPESRLSLSQISHHVSPNITVTDIACSKLPTRKRQISPVHFSEADAQADLKKRKIILNRNKSPEQKNILNQPAKTTDSHHLPKVTKRNITVLKSTSLQTESDAVSKFSSVIPNLEKSKKGRLRLIVPKKKPSQQNEQGLHNTESSCPINHLSQNHSSEKLSSTKHTSLIEPDPKPKSSNLSSSEKACSSQDADDESDQILEKTSVSFLDKSMHVASDLRKEEASKKTLSLQTNSTESVPPNVKVDHVTDNTISCTKTSQETNEIPILSSGCQMSGNRDENITRTPNFNQKCPQAISVVTKSTKMKFETNSDKFKTKTMFQRTKKVSEVSKPSATNKSSVWRFTKPFGKKSRRRIGRRKRTNAKIQKKLTLQNTKSNLRSDPTDMGSCGKKLAQKRISSNVSGSVPGQSTVNTNVKNRTNESYNPHKSMSTSVLSIPNSVVSSEHTLSPPQFHSAGGGFHLQISGAHNTLHKSQSSPCTSSTQASLNHFPTISLQSGFFNRQSGGVSGQRLPIPPTGTSIPVHCPPSAPLSFPISTLPQNAHRLLPQKLSQTEGSGSLKIVPIISTPMNSGRTPSNLVPIRLETEGESKTRRLNFLEKELEKVKKQQVYLAQKKNVANRDDNTKVGDANVGKEVMEASGTNVQSETTCQKADYVKLNQTKLNEKEYDYYDGGDHCCKICGYFCSTLQEFLDHLQSQSHQKLMDGESKPWKKTAPKKESSNDEILTPLNGSEFLHPIIGFYCELCDSYSSDHGDAQEHCKSQLHNALFQKFCKIYPDYETKRRKLLDKLKFAANLNREKSKREIKGTPDRELIDESSKTLSDNPSSFQSAPMLQNQATGSGSSTPVSSRKSSHESCEIVGNSCSEKPESSDGGLSPEHACSDQERKLSLKQIKDGPLEPSQYDTCDSRQINAGEKPNSELHNSAKGINSKVKDDRIKKPFFARSVASGFSGSGSVAEDKEARQTSANPLRKKGSCVEHLSSQNLKKSQPKGKTNARHKKRNKDASNQKIVQKIPGPSNSAELNLSQAPDLCEQVARPSSGGVNASFLRYPLSTTKVVSPFIRRNSDSKLNKTNPTAAAVLEVAKPRKLRSHAKCTANVPVAEVSPENTLNPNVKDDAMTSNEPPPPGEEDYRKGSSLAQDDNMFERMMKAFNCEN